MSKKSSFKVTIKSNGHSCYIGLPEKLAIQFIEAGNKRVICNVDDRYEFHCAILKSKHIGYYIMTGKKTLKAGDLKQGQKIEVALFPDHTKYQSEIPPELLEVLNSDFEGYEKFHKLTLGKQRSIIYMVSGLKSPDKRIERALKIVENIKMGFTKREELLG